MRVSSIQSTIAKPQLRKTENLNRTNYLKQNQNAQPTFKGAKGGLWGLGTGMVGGLLLVGGAAISGALILPAAIGSLFVLGAGAGGAAAGSKIEDKIFGED